MIEEMSIQQELVQCINHFGIELYREMPSVGNLFFSPYVLADSLLLLASGADKSTRESIMDILPVPVFGEALYCMLSSIRTDMISRSQRGGYIFLPANKLWGQKAVTYQTPFLLMMKSYFNKGFSDINFSDDPEGARRVINTWTEKKTSREIMNLLPMGSIIHATRMLLTSAVFFKNNWHRRFDENTTREIAFETSSGETVTSTAMFASDYFPYMETDLLQVLELHYKRGDMSMLIFLPKDRQCLDYAEMHLSRNELDLIVPEMKRRKVLVYLPKFRLSTHLNLQSKLSLLGMDEVFKKQANFKRIANEDLYLDGIYHQSCIEIDEKGLDPSDPEEATWLLKGSSSFEVTFRADHPFMFLVRDNVTDTILFIGRVNNPTETSKRSNVNSTENEGA